MWTVIYNKLKKQTQSQERSKSNGNILQPEIHKTDRKVCISIWVYIQNLICSYRWRIHQKELTIKHIEKEINLIWATTI